MEVLTSMALVASVEPAVPYQQSSQVEPLRNFQAMDQLNFLATNHHKWLSHYQDGISSQLLYNMHGL